MKLTFDSRLRLELSDKWKSSGLYFAHFRYFFCNLKVAFFNYNGSRSNICLNRTQHDTTKNVTVKTDNQGQKCDEEEMTVKVDGEVKSTDEDGTKKTQRGR